jgi:hypothetical protein
MAAVVHAAPHPISRADDEAFIAAQVKLVRDPLAVAVGVRRQQHAFRWPNLLELHAERLASQVERDGDPAFGVLAPIEQQVALRSERPIGAIRQRPTGTDVLLERVLHAFGRNRDLAHANLLTVIDRRCAAQRQQQRRGDPSLVAPDPTRQAGAVVIAQHPIGPAAGAEARPRISAMRGSMSRAFQGEDRSAKLNGRWTPRRSAP